MKTSAVNLLTFYAVINVIILAVSSEVTKEAAAKKTGVTEWMKRITDLGFDCSEHDKEDWAQSHDLLKVVSCDETEGIYAYNIKISGKKKKKLNRKSSWDGKVMISFGDDGQDGIKLGKCIRLQHEGVKRITGTFVENQLEGRVVIDFRNGSVTVGHAERNRLVGVVRKFDENHKFKYIENVISGRLLVDVDPHGQYMFQVDQSELKDRLFFTNDFVAIYTCQTYDSQHLYDCFEISSNALEINQCTIDIKGSERMGACSESTFMINMKTGQKFFPGVDKTYTECVNQTTGEFNTKNVRGSMEKWLETMRKSGQDPFWSLEPSEEPLDPKDPKIDISLPAYQGRHAYMHEQMVLRSSNRLLHVGPMVDGKIQGKINASLADANDWKAPLLLVPARESGATETTGHGNSGRKSMAEDFSTSIKAGRGMTVSGSSDLMSHILFTARIRHGRLHGPVRLFGQLSNDPEALCQERLNWGLSFVGNYKDGVATGYCWKGLLGGAWVVGYVDENGDLTGDNIAYVYPDFKTAFVGKFEKGIMIEAQEAELIGERCEGGIKILQFTEPSGPMFHYDPANKDSLGDQPTLGDPLDNRYLYLKPSEEYPMAGEGSYAKVDVPAHTPFALYGGHIMTPAEMEERKVQQSKDLQERGLSMRDPEAYDTWKYRHNAGYCKLQIDIPIEYGDTEKFRATLGHKVNHKFNPTTFYTQIDSARFGIINILWTNKAIKKDEEYFASYGYNVKTTDLPWYREAYKKFAADFPDQADPSALEAIRMIEEGKLAAAGGATMGEDTTKEGEEEEEKA